MVKKSLYNKRQTQRKILSDRSLYNKRQKTLLLNEILPMDLVRIIIYDCECLLISEYQREEEEELINNCTYNDIEDGLIFNKLNNWYNNMTKHIKDEYLNPDYKFNDNRDEIEEYINNNQNNIKKKSDFEEFLSRFE